ncbi:MAG: DUF1266 domain-containing protein [Lachnospiraceae bacterium]|nr:DUF1266 domain-containing protein [Lachnospiraceae bacterium]
MDYEEAMDAFPENSLRLQKMYDSWDEMMDAYMMGYQFGQGIWRLRRIRPQRSGAVTMKCSKIPATVPMSWTGIWS